MKKADSIRIGRMMLLGCCACAVLGIPNHLQIECHHILDGGRRMGHRFTIPLCKGHHQGYFTADQQLILKVKQLVSIGDGRKLFVEVYGTERELLERVDHLLGLDTPWPASKILPRRAA